MNEKRTCPQCGNPMPPGSTHGLCPTCLMGQAMASRTFGTREDDAPISPPPSPEEIADKFPQFEITECLGRGGMGVVYKARQKSLDRWVAIKVLAPERVHEERFAEHFEREAKTLAKMSHPNIVTVFDHGEADGLFYIVMEFVDGVNLRDLMREGKMEPEQALAIVPPVCEALEYAHGKGVVHRDIKPENLLLDREGRIKITDFGIATIVAAVCDRRNLGGEEESQRRSQTSQTAATMHAGTPAYMAPEQENGNVDRRADIYALGVVLYEMLTGERPAKDLVAPSRKVQLDVKIDEMVLRALEKEPERRYQTADEFRTMVETIATHTGSAGVPPGSPTGKSIQGPSGETPDGARGARALPEPRFSRAAIWGAVCHGLALVGIVITAAATARATYLAVQAPDLSMSDVAARGNTIFTSLIAGQLLAFLATLVATILGWVAVSQIRHSAGKLYGLGLAVFDGLLLPLLALNAGIVLLGGALGQALMDELTPVFGVGIYRAVAFTLIALACLSATLLIIRRVWRAAKKPLDSPSLESVEPPARLLGVWWIPVIVATALSVIWGVHADLEAGQTGWFVARMLLVPFAVFLAFLGIARRWGRSQDWGAGAFGKVALGVAGVVVFLFLVENLVFPPLKRALWTARVGVPKFSASLPRLSRISHENQPGVFYLDFDEKRSVTGLKLPNNNDDRTRDLNESGADLMVDLPPKMTSWSFVTPVDKPIRLAKVSVDTWKNPSRLFHRAEAPIAAVKVSSSTPAPLEADLIQVRGGDVACRAMPSKEVENNEVIADVIEIPQRRPPADPESNVFLFETAEGTQGLLRIAGVTFDSSDDRDGLRLEFIVFTDRFVAELAKGTPESYRTWVGDVDLNQPELFVDQGGYWPGARGVDESSFVRIDKSGLALTADDIGEIAAKTRLTHLDLTDSSIGDVNLPAFHKLQSLVSAKFNATLADTAHKPRITDAGLEHVARWKKLRNLELHGLPISDAGLGNLSHLSELRSLQLSNTKVRGEGLVQLRELSKLQLVSTPVRDDDLRHIAQLQKLEQLYLDSTDISDAGLEHLTGMKRLRILNVHNTKVTAKGIADLEARMPGIVIGWDKPEESVAETAPASGPYKLKLSDDYTFEIRAICRNPRNNPQWFRPDGTPFEKPPYEILALYEPLSSDYPHVPFKPEDEIFVVYGDENHDGGEVPSFRLRWSPGDFGVRIGLYKGSHPAVRDPNTGKPYQLVDQFGLRESVNQIDLEVSVVTANAKWEPVATFDGVETKDIKDKYVLFSPPRYDEKARRYVIDVMHDYPRENQALRLRARMKDGHDEIVTFHPGIYSGTPTKGFAHIHDHDFDIKQVKEWVLERTPLLKGRINGIALRPGQPSEAAADSEAADREVELRNIIREIQLRADQHRVRIVANPDGTFELSGHRLVSRDELKRIAEAYPPRRDHRMMEVVSGEDPVDWDFWNQIGHTMQCAEIKVLRPDEIDTDRELAVAVRGAWGGPGPKVEKMILNPKSPDVGEYLVDGDEGTWAVEDGFLIREIKKSRRPGRTGKIRNKIIEASDRMLVLEDENGGQQEWYRMITFHNRSLWRFPSTTDRGKLDDFFTRRERDSEVYDLHTKAQVVYRGKDGIVYERPDLASSIVERYDVIDGVARYYGPLKGVPSGIEQSKADADPEAAVAMLAAFKGHYGAARTALEKGDTETALISLRMIESQSDKFLESLEGLPIKPAIEGA